ncbi:MAG: hypothetical protein HC923_07115, partial [Myxococcales bacterium]|nr:hypothetical protein [Myxococcales bacterium]
SQSYDRLEFKGLVNMTEGEARLLTVAKNRMFSGNQAEQHRLELIDRYRELGYYFAAIEIRTDATAYTAMAYGPKVCLVVGHEDHGVPQKVLERCSGSVFIPMFGKGASLNVHVALSVVAFHALSRRPGSGGRGGPAGGFGVVPTRGAPRPS